MICFRIRLKISSAIESGGPLPDNLKTHLGSCASCRRFHDRQRAVVNRLQKEAPVGTGYPAGLNASILRAIREPVPTPARRDPAQLRVSPWLAPLSFASIALVAALYLILRQPASSPPRMADQEAPAREQNVAAEKAPGDYIRSWSVAINQPLDNELDSVVADARSAVRFLAINFLPEPQETENL